MASASRCERERHEALPQRRNRDHGRAAAGVGQVTFIPDMVLGIGCFVVGYVCGHSAGARKMLDTIDAEFKKLFGNH